MGLLRCILALLVVGSHLKAFGGAGFAVKAFFIVSGFYMALVLHGRYGTLPVSSFYASRLLRLLPLYWVVAIATVAAEYVLVPRGQYLSEVASPLAYGQGLDLSAMSWPMLAYIGTTLVTMLGLDTGQWLGFSRLTGELSVFPNYGANATSVMAINPVPQGWTIGLELLFYLIAPFLMRRSTRLIVALCVGSLAFRLALAQTGYSGEPWNRSLFPSELIYFLLGVLGYRLYRRLPELGLPRRIEITLALMVLGIAVTYWPLHYVFRNSAGVLLETVPYALLALGIPFLFKLTKDYTLDAAIGELSYPIYICHALVIGVVRWSPLHDSALFANSLARATIMIALVIGLSYLLDRVIVVPVDRFRQRFGARERPEWSSEDGGAHKKTAAQAEKS